MLGDARTHYLRCGFARDGATTFGRKDHLYEHLRADHSLTNMSERAKSWSFPIYSEWPRRCGFCGIFFDTWEQRTIHIGRHYQNGTHKSSWKLPFPQPQMFGLSDDDNDDEDDDFSSCHPPHGKGSSHSFHNTSSGSCSSNLAPSTYQEKGAQMYPHHTSQQSQTHSRYSGDHDNLAIQSITSSPPSCQPSLPLQRYLSETEDHPHRLFTSASSQDPHKRNSLSAIKED